MVVLGKDTSWDFRNYHWYAPYAFLNNRLGIDVAVAHQASYYNPFLDIPFYWLATHTHSWIALAVLGAVQGANIVPLYLIAREGLAACARRQRLAAGALALLGQFGALTLTEFGTTYYDNVMSVFVFSGLAILIVNRDTLARRAACARRAAGGAGRLCHRHGDGPEAAGNAFLRRLCRGAAGAGRQLAAAGGAADRRRHRRRRWASRCSAPGGCCK